MFKKKKAKLIQCPKCNNTFREDEIVDEGQYGNDWFDLCPYCNSYLEG